MAWIRDHGENRPLRRLLGTTTALLVGMGVAIGSGIFRSPGELAEHVPSPAWFIVAWVVAGVIVLVQGLVTAELATRFPRAGGEYVFLREAYGRFAAFFFGWAYTIFVIGGGAATIAAVFGEFAAELFHIDATMSRWFAAGAIIVVTAINALGLSAGAGTQNLLTVLKIVLLLLLVGMCLFAGPADVSQSTTVAAVDPHANEQPSGSGLGMMLLAGILPVLWAYDGTTDSVKLAEEIKDARRALPRAIIGATVALMALYVLVNVALLHVVPLKEMPGRASVAGEAAARVIGPAGRAAMLTGGMLVCLGSMSSTVLATIRVTFALARDGLTFRRLARMSEKQAPVAALWTVGGFSILLVMYRDFGDILRIYYLASAVLFGLSYASLLVFRHRNRRQGDAESGAEKDVFRCPFGPMLACGLLLFQLFMAANIVRSSPRDALYTVVLLAICGLGYLLWTRLGAGSGAAA